MSEEALSSVPEHTGLHPCKLVHGTQQFFCTGTAAGLCFKPNKPCLTTASFATPNCYMNLHLFFCSAMCTLPSELQIIKRKLGLLCSVRWFTEQAS